MPGLGPGPAPPKKKPRWWLRILVALSVLGVVVVLGGIALVVGLGVLGFAAFASLPNAQHPAASVGGGIDPTCAAAARCCTLGGGDASECADYASSTDLDDCRAAIGSYGDAIAQSGGDASACSPYYGP
jgi:hypothetical protein